MKSRFTQGHHLAGIFPRSRHNFGRVVCGNPTPCNHFVHCRKLCDEKLPRAVHTYLLACLHARTYESRGYLQLRREHATTNHRLRRSRYANIGRFVNGWAGGGFLLNFTNDRIVIIIRILASSGRCHCSIHTRWFNLAPLVSPATIQSAPLRHYEILVHKFRLFNS